MLAHLLWPLRPAGWRWHLTPDAAAVLGPGDPDPDRWTAVVVKENPYRTVERVELPGGAVYVKRCRVRGPRAWWREVLRGPKARLEFDHAGVLADRGIDAVRPLAWGRGGSWRPGASVLITRELDGVPLLRLLERELPPADRRALAVALGRFFARLHDAGVIHPDPHPGNFLLTDGRPSLLDVHAVRLGRPLNWPASRSNLVLVNRWFQLRATRPDRLRFWRAYLGARTTLFAFPLEAMFLATQVERLTSASNRRFWAGRSSRCLGTNRYFRRVRAGAVSGHAVRDLPEEILKDFLAAPAALFARPGAKLLKDSRTSTVAELVLPLADGPRAVVLKRVNVRHWSEPVKDLLRPSAVLRSWANGHALRDRLLPTPRPLAVVHVRRRGLPAEGYLLIEKVPDAVELTRKSVDAALHPLARLLRQMHDRHVSHRDLKAANVLLEAGRTPTLIDLVGVRVGRPVGFRQRAKELARLNASFLNSSVTPGGRPGASPRALLCRAFSPQDQGSGGPKGRDNRARGEAPGPQPVVTRGDRLRFLRAYLAAGERLSPGWKEWWRAVARATAAKVGKNRRSGRPLA